MGHLLSRFSRCGLLLFVFPALSVSAAPTDNPQATYRTGVSEVRLIFSASDQNEHTVANLNASDFAVVDRDVIVRKFQSFTRPEFTRLEMSILIDASASMKPHYREEVAQVVELISETSGVADESLSIITFQGLKPSVVCTHHCADIDMTDVLPATPPQGTTPLYDTLIYAADVLSEKHDPQARRIAILFSDGNDTVSKNSASDAIETVLANDVQVYAIRTSSRPNDFLEALVSATGGRTFRLSDGATSVARAVLADFRASYQVTYRLPDRSSGFHTLRILPTHDMNLHFRCRRGYYYPTGR